MRKLHIGSTPTTPEIIFSPDENIFLIQGTSAPEDVRALYYPVIEWIRIFTDEIVTGEIRKFTNEDPLSLEIDLAYFNSSSAKFLYDILNELKRIPADICPVTVTWKYDEEDIDMKDAGHDIATLAGMEFHYLPKIKN